MPQNVKFTIQTKLASGLKIDDQVLDTNVNTYNPLIEEIPADKTWRPFEVLGGKRENICFLLLGAQRYADKDCKSNQPGLLFKFAKDESVSQALDGPVLYSGPTKACLPDQVDTIYIKNSMNAPVIVTFFIGRRCEKMPEQSSGAPAAAAAAAPAPAPAPVAS